MLTSDHIKWYGTFDEVTAWVRLAEMASEQVDQGICYEFIRIGEDYEDTEVNESGNIREPLLYFARDVQWSPRLQASISDNLG